MEWWMYLVAYVLLQPVFAGIWAMFTAGNRRMTGEGEVVATVARPRAAKAAAAPRIHAHSM